MTVDKGDITADDTSVIAPNGSGDRRILRTTTYIFLIIILFAATVAIVAGAFFAVTALSGVKSKASSIVDPVSDLVRQLVIEATPVILPNPVVIIEEINDLARLETRSYSFQDVLQIERNQDLLWGAFGESLLFVAYGDVIAGVDLAKLSSDDLQVLSPTEVVVRLPEAEIFFTTLDNDRSYVADRDRGLLAGVDADLETRVRQEAESKMLETALADGILDQADEEAQKFIGTFLSELGFTEIQFSENKLPIVTPVIPELPKGFVSTPVVPPLVTPEP